ncbi:hypothetical protein BJY52DRAFT_1423126, partial [Lactarius psammicola]
MTRWNTDPFNSLPGSPNAAEVSFNWEIQGKIPDPLDPGLSRPSSDSPSPSPPPSSPPNPLDEESFTFGLEDIPRPGKDLDPEPSHLSISSRSRSHLPSPLFPSNSLDVTASPQSPTTEKSGEVMTEPVPPSKDPTCPITGMYRLLDLIMEQGNSGLVDKIVVAQKSLQAFINALSPGAYSSITKVNFKILDNLLLKPIGVYGSKEEIVRFLREMSAVDVEMARELLVPQREQTYVLYWPEDTTWDDNAVSTVQRSRVTFMRYLTKLCDQLVCLLSAEHSKAIVWEDEVADPDDASFDSDNDDSPSHRLFDFRVEKKSEQEENVIVRQGFTGFMTVDFRPARATVEPFSHDRHSASQIGIFFEDDVVLCLSETLDDKALETLMGLGLSTRFTKEYEAWERRKIEIEKRFQKTITQRQADVHVTLQNNFGDIQAKVREAVIDEILKAFRMLQHDGFSSASTSAAPVNSIDSGEVAVSIFRRSILAANFDKGVKGKDFQYRKERMLILLYLFKNYQDLNAHQARSLCDAILFNWDRQKTLKLLKSFAKGEKSLLYSVFWKGREAVVSKEEAMWRDANNYATSISDARFLSYVKTFTDAHILHDAAVECEQAAYDCLTTQLDSLIEECDKQVQREVKNEEEKELKISRVEFVQQIGYLSKEHSRSRITIHIDNFTAKKEHHYAPVLADQRHNLQLDPSYVPIPVLDDKRSQSFHIPWRPSYAHLLEGDRILLGLVDSQGNIMIFLDRLSHIDGAIQSRSYAKFLHQDKIGETCLFAFDESKRMLAVYASTRMQLHIFVFDEELKSLRGLGTPIDLLPFYNPGVSITHACFVHGSEEILFIDSSAQARIFSLITLQPKPASLQLPQMPRAIYSSPDGSCVIVVQDEDGERTITAYHWSTLLPPVEFPLHSQSQTSLSISTQRFSRRSSIGTTSHLIGLDLDSRSCRSVILNITQRATEFTFQERRSKASSRYGKQTIHNCLIDCYSGVWTLFPVVPTVECHIITSSSQRQQKTLVFVTDDHRRPFSSHFSDIISAFEKTSRKPTGDELKSIVVSARPFASFTQEFLTSFRLAGLAPQSWRVASIRSAQGWRCITPAGEVITWCGVNRIVDSLSLGWYESIFQSYWASKPVKVVSSMGEQSVGKSFALNHLVDTSFAGSALRTTEGVWMSVLPTEDALIVALDFEGVHSLERSAQEDTLLVLFNTAISNLILFRTDFALSRDITGLFQSFQSSSSVLDPKSNPSLFQSTLVTIIKDVIDSDKAEVTKEFALKFLKIVQDERGANFITRLHAGKLQIIPWPVIGSREFYKLFSSVKKMLDQQRTSHNTAGEFLHTLKTLMAKLKANDWGAMSQTMAAHRSNSLLAILPVALETGYSKVVPELEPLKVHRQDFDTDLVVETEDTEARFLLAGPDMPAADREHRLSILRDSWDRSGSRQHVDDSEWVYDLVQYLTRLVDLRVAHVDKWLKSNIQRFQAEHTSIEELRRTFNSAVIDLRAGVQLCKSQICGQSAGHKGDHVCYIDNHLCGQPCGLSGKRGCVDECVQPASHEGDHLCSAPLHMCGQPCDLINLESPNGKSFTCSGMCCVPISEEHTVHACEHRLCPISCRLCKRLCNGDHLHGLSRSENHLCGQEHTCSAFCSAAGICQIDTIPQSIEATFAGGHETFQYTKYTQAAKRLRCVKLIEPGEIEHEGPHIHNDEEQPFHYCESRCETCGNFCTLPLGHSQQQHETSHGSMSRARWAIEGLEEDSVELGGRKFSLNDDGAPMLCNLVCTSIGRHVHIDYC